MSNWGKTDLVERASVEKSVLLISEYKDVDTAIFSLILLLQMKISCKILGLICKLCWWWFFFFFFFLCTSWSLFSLLSAYWQLQTLILKHYESSHVMFRLMTRLASSSWLRDTEVINLKLSIRSCGSLFHPSWLISVHTSILDLKVKHDVWPSLKAVTVNSPSDLILKGNNDFRSIYNALFHCMHVRLCRKAPCEDLDLDVWLRGAGACAFTQAFDPHKSCRKENSPLGPARLV